MICFNCDHFLRYNSNMQNGICDVKYTPVTEETSCLYDVPQKVCIPIEVIKQYTDQEWITIEKIGLLNVTEYQKHKKNIPPVNFMWWLSSKGMDSIEAERRVMEVYESGYVLYCGSDVTYMDEIRPLLTLAEDSIKLEIGDKFYFKGYCWTVIFENNALCDESIGRKAFKRDGSTDEYTSSDIATFLNEWIKGE